MNKVKVIVGVILVFTLGGLAGSLGTQLYFKHRMERFVQGGPPPVMHGFMRKMFSELNLTEAQRSPIEKIVSQADEKLLSLREKFRPEFEKIIDDTMEKIKQKLNDDQKKKLERLREEFRKMGTRRPHLPPPPFPPPGFPPGKLPAGSPPGPPPVPR